MAACFDKTQEIADECVACGTCVDACPYLATYVGTPDTRAVPYAEQRAYVTEPQVPYLCNICGLCAEVCPFDLDSGAMMEEIRQHIVEEDDVSVPGYIAMVAEHHADTTQPDYPILRPAPSGTTKRLFFPGCNLPGYSAEVALACVRALQRRDPDCGVLMACCGAPLLDSGDRATYEAMVGYVQDAMESCGATELVTACSNCCKHFSDNTSIRVTSAYDLLAADWGDFEGETAHADADGCIPGVGMLTTNPTPDALGAGGAASHEVDGRQLVLHDPCKSRQFPQLQASVRRLLERLGYRFSEPEATGALTHCCGQGGMVAYTDYTWSDRIGRERCAELEAAGGAMLTYCATCRNTLGFWGMPGLHVLDLLFRDPEELPTLLTAQTGQDRAANREAFRAALLAEF